MTRLVIQFVGTGAGAPSPERGAPAILIRREGTGLLFDCGEATQLALRRLKFGYRGLRAIFVTHMHGDHVLGLPGLLMSLSLSSFQKKVDVFGPTGITEFLQNCFTFTGFSPGLPLSIHDIEATTQPLRIFWEKGFSVYSVGTDHTMPSLAYSVVEDPRPGRFIMDNAIKLGVPKGVLWKKLQEGETVTVAGRQVTPSQVLEAPRRGRKVVYSGDTRPCTSVLNMGLKSDVLIHEAAMPDEDLDAAIAGGHSTLSEALRIIRESQCLKGVITNFGQRVSYESLRRLSGSEVICAFDGLSLEVPLP